jgi:hypothetical protein
MFMFGIRKKPLKKELGKYNGRLRDAEVITDLPEIPGPRRGANATQDDRDGLEHFNFQSSCALASTTRTLLAFDALPLVLRSYGSHKRSKSNLTTRTRQ